MYKPFSNAAYLTFEYGKNSGYAVSNATSVSVTSPLKLNVQTLQSFYNMNSTITYIISTENCSKTDIENITLKDNLGTYISETNDVLCTPLSYNKSAKIYLNGIYKNDIDPTIYADGIVFNLPVLKSGAKSGIIYSLSPNKYSPLQKNSEIRGSITLASPTTPEISELYSIKCKEQADVKIIKQAINLGQDENEYRFFIYNYGNTDAQKIKLTDELPFSYSSGLNLFLNDESVSENDYNLLKNQLTFPCYGSSLKISVPAAEFEQNKENGEYISKPGVTTIKIKNKL